MAEDSKVNKLLLTHFWYGTNLEEVRKEAASIYSGPLVIAEDGTHIEI
jgi:ribonuclease BN (tRNA processing enzyme)